MDVRVVEGIALHDPTGLVGVGSSESGIVVIGPRHVAAELVHLTDAVYFADIWHSAVEFVVESGV